MTELDKALERLGSAMDKRKRPLAARRMECSGCDCYALCYDVQGAWLCRTCKQDAKAFGCI